MTLVRTLITGAGPGNSLREGTVLMRRPRVARPAPATGPGWSHPYTGTPAALAVCHADGGDPPEPSDPAPAAPAPKPAPPAGTVTLTQDELSALAAREKSQGKRSALKEFAEEHGFTTVEDAKAFIAAARKAQDDALSEQEKQAKQLEEDRRKVEEERASIAEQRRTLAREQALTRLGALDTDDNPNLQDALAILDRALKDQPDADPETIRTEAEKVKTRRPELFGAAKAADPEQRQTPPPAPGGAPAGGPPSRPAPTGKPGDRGLEMARLRGHKRAA